MRQFMVSSLFATTLAACYKDDEEGLSPSPDLNAVDSDQAAGGLEVTGDTSDPDDSNGDGVDDVMQSVGPGYESDGSPYWVVFNGATFPAYTDNLGVVGYGGGAYGTDDDGNDWSDSWAPLVDFNVDGVTVGKAFRNIRDGKYEINCADLGGADRDPFELYVAEGWCVPAVEGMDDPDWFTTHVDGADCPES